METADSIPADSPPSPSNRAATPLGAALQQSQIDIEAEKSALANTLHDDLIALLVGAIMDVGWIANQPGLPAMVTKRLARTEGLMRAAIDMTRDLIENLRPSLLDNVGLYSTLHWHMKASCRAAAVPYTESFPISEQTMSMEIKLCVFRIFQEALRHALGQRAPADLSVAAEVVGDTLHCHLMHRLTAQDICEESMHSPETSMHHRAARVGGTLDWDTSLAGHRHMHLQVPVVLQT